MNFDESVKYLYGLGNEVLAMKLGLENIRLLLAALGSQQNRYLKVQIAGTNGKGSTCAFLEAICLRAGIKTGTTTSPHLVSVNERVRIGGREISETDFARHATIVRETSEKLVEAGALETVPTFFEQVTAIALNAFAECEIELAILETGLGGRFDAITAANAEIVGITPIDYDHQRILGNTLAEIAAEKAAIIREDTKVVIANQLPEAMRIILERCARFGVTPSFAAEVDAAYASKLFTNSEQSFLDFGLQITNFQTSKAKYENVRLNLHGKHQVENAKTAILLAETLQDNFKITGENIIDGLESAVHKGRLEFNENYLFDGAHNASGARALHDFLNEFVKLPVVMIFGAMRDKDLSEIAEILFPKAAALILTTVANERSQTAEELEKFVPADFDKNKIFIARNVREALETAEKIASERNLILVTGSLYLVGEAQKILSEGVKKADFRENL
jgi:dihydrofolate synthase/folylpolyglutamate synthase